VATPQPEIIDLGKWQIPEETDVEEETITNYIEAVMPRK
jgi:hypothetical protein